MRVLTLSVMYIQSTFRASNEQDNQRKGSNNMNACVRTELTDAQGSPVSTVYSTLAVREDV